jgi:predicted MFS family arabinose efflux permease
MLAMVVFGIGELCGCLFIGKIIDKTNSKFAAIVDVIIIIV